MPAWLLLLLPGALQAPRPLLTTASGGWPARGAGARARSKKKEKGGGERAGEVEGERRGERERESEGRRKGEEAGKKGEAGRKESSR